ncbi:hypothetical protein IFM89_010482 [Coptis chinensis]|uniref:Phytocyanin domain-containing protein n=1 Tax=Coptis chinensis TaxID=261450 RepID=A0A835ICC5_9MAGN|nr:hypothetical protein IFM89_010482 [Coptis chinensis]
MASTRTLVSSLVFVFLFLFSFSEAREFLVGGKTDSWKIPSSPSESLNEWSKASRFNIGDTIVWKYDSKNDSVFQVTKSDYANCNVSSPIAQYNDGNTTVKLEKPGPYYFISGAKGHCEKGQKIIVVVITPRTKSLGAISPAPSPSEFSSGPAVARTSGVSGLKCGLMMVVLGSWLGMVLV